MDVFKILFFFVILQVLQVAPNAPVDVTILHVLSVLLVNAHASLLSGNVMETMTVGTTVMKMAAVRIPFLTCVCGNSMSLTSSLPVLLCFTGTS